MSDRQRESGSTDRPTKDRRTASDHAGAESFVVWLDAVEDRRGEDVTLRGVVERMVDSTRAAFESSDELLALMTRRPARDAREPARPASPNHRSPDRR